MNVKCYIPAPNARRVLLYRPQFEPIHLLLRNSHSQISREGGMAACEIIDEDIFWHMYNGWYGCTANGIISHCLEVPHHHNRHQSIFCFDI